MQIETGFLCEIGCGDGGRVICLFARCRVIQPLGFWTQKIRADVDYCCVWRREVTRRVHFASAVDANIHAQTLVWPHRDVPRRFTRTFFCNQAADPSTVTYCCFCCCCCCCVYSRKIRSHERRPLGALLYLVSGSEPASIDS